MRSVLLIAASSLAFLSANQAIAEETYIAQNVNNNSEEVGGKECPQGCYRGVGGKCFELADYFVGCYATSRVGGKCLGAADFEGCVSEEVRGECLEELADFGGIREAAADLEKDFAEVCEERKRRGYWVNCDLEDCVERKRNIQNIRAFNFYYNRGNHKYYKLGDYQGALADYNKAIQIDPKDAAAYYNRGNVNLVLKDAAAYYNRGNVNLVLGDQQGACADYKKAASLGLELTEQYLNSEGGAWCRNMR